MEFNTLVILLFKRNFGDLIHAFLYGCKANLCPLVKAQVAYKDAPSLAEAMAVAV